ncbi:fructosamine kinase family protein [Maritimibacter sp. DP1N21-5]|uniref:fructosamine kinase family protein n=1 Tax=Maritimibacter sp. DP1N21-5 TaxID=2836867 RepID=UPI001C463C7D|nr:fructosamine kinase family protein [Maritimibacter sp. DP1N21-5]MBV7410357.1 fructosamine kinase family protein [Maritimibacter sp. DP1N21-5]
MSDPDALDATTLSLFGECIARRRALHGGGLSQVSHVTLRDGRAMVVKMGPLVAREARMLTALRDARTPVPEVLGQSGAFLFLEHLEEAAPGAASWAAVGDVLSRQHAVTGTDYGWTESYAFRNVIIPAQGGTDWPDHWAATRLLPQIRHLPGLGQRLTRACERLPRLLPRAPRPGLLHGDLWTGNILFGPGGQIHFIDPACAYGDREVDLAMLTLFGRPGPEFDRAYGPLEPGWEVRRHVYQLWPALVHLRLFGTSYRGLVERLLAAIGA